MTDQQASNIIRLKRKRRRRSKNRAPGQMLAFPPGRHRRIISFIAGKMREQPSLDAAEEYLIGHLHIEAGRLAGIGIADVEIEQLCDAFAVAAWTIVLKTCDAEGVA
jgi:hypothetical protein